MQIVDVPRRTNRVPLPGIILLVAIVPRVARGDEHRPCAVLTATAPDPVFDFPPLEEYGRPWTGTHPGWLTHDTHSAAIEELIERMLCAAQGARVPPGKMRLVIHGRADERGPTPPVTQVAREQGAARSEEDREARRLANQ